MVNVVRPRKCPAPETQKPASIAASGPLNE